MSKKTWIGLALLSSFATMNLASAVPVIHILVCNQAGKSKNPITVGIAAELGTADGKPKVHATVSDRNNELGNYIVAQKDFPRGTKGAPLIYTDVASKGKKFTLDVNVDSAPIDSGRRAHVTAEATNGARISEDLVCLFTR